MKHLIVLLTLLISTTAFGAEPDSPQNGVEHTASKIGSGLTQNNISNMKMKICLAMSKGKSDPSVSIPGRIKTIIIKYGEIDPNSTNVDAQMAEVWNRYADQMVCPATNGVYPTQHIYKRAIALRVEKAALVDFFLKDTRGFPINMNAVETRSDGSKETVLDYLDRIMGDPEAKNKYNLGQAIRLRSIIERRFDGKRAREL